MHLIVLSHPPFHLVLFFVLFAVLLRLGVELFAFLNPCMKVPIKGFLVDFLIASAVFAGCNYSSSTANRWNGNSYDDNDFDCTQVTASKVRKCLGTISALSYVSEASWQIIILLL